MRTPGSPANQRPTTSLRCQGGTGTYPRVRKEHTSKNPPPLAEIQDIHDEAEEALARHEYDRLQRVHEQLRTRLAEQALRDATGESIARNGMTDRSRRLLRAMGWTVARIT